MRKNKFNPNWDFFLKAILILSVSTLLGACTKSKVSAEEAAGTPPADQSVPVGITPGSGVCGSANNLCIKGTLNDVADSATQYLWQCTGSGTGTSPSCSLNIPPPNEVVDPLCVQVFYDRDNQKLAREYALMIINLLGHFPKHPPILGPIELYKKGDLERCAASFYVGMTKNNPLPADFIADYKVTTKQMIWLGANFWELGADFEKDFGYKTHEFTKLDKNNLTPAPESKPSFFRDILYKGEVFSKYNEWLDKSHKNLDGDFELVKLTGKTSDVATVLGQAKHSFTGEVIPWALQSGNKFYMSEVPLSYFWEGDRYMAFTDLMFDFLKEQPQTNLHRAYIRFEDIGPNTDLPHLQEAMDILHKHSITPHVNLYPIYVDPLDVNKMGKGPLRMENDPLFFAAIKKYTAEGTNWIWHGITHQYSNFKNPYTGASGDDYEFWDFLTKSPIPEDSVDYVLNMFDDGFNSFKLAGISPKIWVTPHYLSPPLDNVLTGQMFPWMVSRSDYFDSKIEGLKERDASIYWDANNITATATARRTFFTDLKATIVPGMEEFGQIYPYEIWGDIYRQRIIPEDLGNVEPKLTNQVEFVRSVDSLLADAKRNLVIRDSWAAAFYHPYLLDPKENAVNKDTTQPKDLEKLVTGIQNMGYTFVSLNDFVTEHMNDAVNKPRIELDDIRK